jgi:hypothetical protein
MAKKERDVSRAHLLLAAPPPGAADVGKKKEKKKVDSGGFDPPTSRMLSARATNCANRPDSHGRK